MSSDLSETTEPGAAPDEAAPDSGRAPERYVILERAGRGGMGEVFVAYDRKLDRKVALKVLLRAAPEDQARLTREAHAMARLSHANVVAVFDSGTFDGRLFLAMEFVAGSTVDRWLSDRKPGWRDVLRVYVEAGKGLAAAHAAGLVHRDFKPSNVMVDDAGRVKVTDFGLARAVGREQAAGEAAAVPPSRRFKSLETPVTQEGMVIGTPGYMAPEQWRAEQTDARTDQFSFCVALYEGLYGTKPFPGDDPDARYEGMVRGEIRDAPKGTRVPSAVRRAVLRGLSVDPAARHPSMEALLEALALDRGRRRWGAAAAIGAVVALVATALGFGRAAAERQVRLCSGADAESEAVWGPEVQQEVQSSLLATGVPYAADTWERTRRNVDDYMAGWRAMHRETCEATRIRGEQSEEVMTARMACLQQRRDDVAALARVLSHADAHVAAKAVQASLELPSIRACQDVVSLLAAPPLPADEARRVEVLAIRRALADVQGDLSADRNSEAVDAVEPLVARARAAGYAPALALALTLSCEGKLRARARVDARVDCEEGAREADAAHDDAMRVRDALFLVNVEASLGDLDGAQQWLDAAGATLRRTNDDGELRARWLDGTGWLLSRQSRYAEAIGPAREALETARRAKVDLVLLGRVTTHLTSVLVGAGRHDEATKLLDEWDAEVIRVAGDSHPLRLAILDSRAWAAAAANDSRAELDYARKQIELAQRVDPDDANTPNAWNNACDALVRLEQYAEAVDTCAQAIAASDRIDGPRSRRAAVSRLSMGEALVGLKRWAEARDVFEQALAISADNGAQGAQYALVGMIGMGEALVEQGRAREAIPVLEKALSADDGVLGKTAVADQYRGELRWALARALRAVQGSGARERDLARDAATSYRRGGADQKANAVERWSAADR